jgi:hypothetical protein
MGDLSWKQWASARVSNEFFDWLRIFRGTRACLSINWISAPAHLGISPTEEILATFNGQLADWHLPTAPALDESGRMMSGGEGVRLLTWGDPVLTVWLETVQGNIDLT